MCNVAVLAFTVGKRWSGLIVRAHGAVGGVHPGSGNAIAKSMDCEDPMAATFALIRGKAAPWDIMGIKQGDHVLYSHLSLTHAMIADIDIGYEAYRYRVLRGSCC